MRIEKELMRGAGPIAILKLLERHELYGYELIERLARQSNGVLTMGESTLYPLLYNLESKGLIEGIWREADSGRRRKYYRLTKKGRGHLERSAREWQRLAETMQTLGIVSARLAGEGVPA
ncbi:lineage-specific thermal regulator protein [Phycisphaerae bacterium RAS2]|nr:lineage-specific thermal regulator protein [Phycisphaerae bacterium RAS2]